MSKIKIMSRLIVMVCLIILSIFLMAGFPEWGIATQSVIRLHYSPALDEASIPSPDRREAGSHAGGIDRSDGAASKAEEPETAIEPSSDLPDRGEYPADAEGTGSEAIEDLSRNGETQPGVDSQPLTGESQSPAESPAVVSPQEPVQAEPEKTMVLPGAPDTPIHPYYDEAGNPPTAPGLAMRQRSFHPETQKMAFLTFDDGPYPSTTPRILAILAEENLHATFFNIGRQMELYPDLLKAEYEQGHAIGNHTYSHNMAEVYKGPEYFLADVKKAEEIIYNTIGIRPLIVRAPGGTVGHFNIKYFNAVDAEGYLMEDWNVDPGDTRARLVPAEQILQNVERQIQGKNRVVILLHDLVGKETTIEALPKIIELLRKEGFSFGVLGPDVLPMVFTAGLQN
ncbi:polysaccharide deacetylase family protein [Desulfosporosinus youngiae]|nr:polysaccharide deacetylase family protein [Desulfosporosinus youngiae]